MNKKDQEIAMFKVKMLAEKTKGEEIILKLKDYVKHLESQIDLTNTRVSDLESNMGLDIDPTIVNELQKNEAML